MVSPRRRDAERFVLLAMQMLVERSASPSGERHWVSDEMAANPNRVPGTVSRTKRNRMVEPRGRWRLRYWASRTIADKPPRQISRKTAQKAQ